MRVGENVDEGDECGVEDAGHGEVDVAVPGCGRLLEDDDRDGETWLWFDVEIDTLDYAATDVLGEGGESRLVREVHKDYFTTHWVRIDSGKEHRAIRAERGWWWRQQRRG